METQVVVIDNVTYRESIADTETRLIWAFYTDTRETASQDGTLACEGSVEMTNYREEKAIIRYRQYVPIPPMYKPIPSSIWEPLCHEGDFAVYMVENTVLPGQFTVTSIYWEMYIVPVSDINEDFVVDATDIGILLSDWGTSESRSDLDRNGIIDGTDLGILLSQWSS